MFLAALSDVEGKFLADVAYAKRKGVDMKELLRVLSARKGKSTFNMAVDNIAFNNSNVLVLL